MAKTYSLTIRNRIGALAFAAAVVGVGAILVTVGLALLAALAVGGGLLGAGFSLYHRLRGGRTGLRQGPAPAVGLDPALEIQPTEPAVVRTRISDGDPPS